MKQPTKKRFLADLQDIREETDQHDPLIRTYRHVVEFFQRPTPISTSDFVVAVQCAYGWMPRMLELKGTTAMRAIEFVMWRKGQSSS